MTLVTEWATYPHFTAAEMACRCGCGALPDPDLMHWLESVRTSYGYPMVVISGARCEKHNAAVGGAADSMHVRGLAVDVSVHGIMAMSLIGVAKLWGVQGLGLMQHGPVEKRYVHLDIGKREAPTLWTYP